MIFLDVVRMPRRADDVAEQGGLYGSLLREDASDDGGYFGWTVCIDVARQVFSGTIAGALA